MKTAILVLGYKKIETFSKVIEALSKQTKQYDLYVKLDNCGDISYTNKLVDKVKEYFPNANISIRPKQFGLDLQVICSINEMFLLSSCISPVNILNILVILKIQRLLICTF